MRYEPGQYLLTFFWICYALRVCCKRNCRAAVLKM